MMYGGAISSDFPYPRRGEGGERSEPGEGRSVSHFQHLEPLTPALSPSDGEREAEVRVKGK